MVVFSGKPTGSLWQVPKEKWCVNGPTKTKQCVPKSLEKRLWEVLPVILWMVSSCCWFTYASNSVFMGFHLLQNWCRTPVFPPIFLYIWACPRCLVKSSDVENQQGSPSKGSFLSFGSSASMCVCTVCCVSSGFYPT